MTGPEVAGLAGCCRCPRLARYIAALPPKRGFSHHDYWGRPVPGFGDSRARICLVGLAPGAHGANRTGRPFTGDGAGDFMYPLLHRAGLASRPCSVSRTDGLVLQDLYITNAVKCVPPGNKPDTAEFANCLPFLAGELAGLPHLKVVLLLGSGAYRSYLRLLQQQERIERLSDHPFGHGRIFRPGTGPWVAASYHTSRYNVQTGRLTEAMFLSLLEEVKSLAETENG